MPVELFTDGIEPEDHHAVIWRFMDLWKFRDMIATATLHFTRADLFPQDDEEGLPPVEYQHVLGLHPLDIRDRGELNHHIASMAQFREGFYINCWYLFDEELPKIWRRYGEDGVAVVSRYDRLKAAMSSFDGRPHLGLVRYGSKHLTGWNTIRFITTKRERFADDREVRALLWIPDQYAGVTRHFDDRNWPHERPLTPPPPDRVPDFHRRGVDLQSLVTELVVSPFALEATLEAVRRLVEANGLSIPSRSSDLTRFHALLP